MPVNKTYSVRYYCETEGIDIYEDQIDAVALPAADPSGHLTGVLRDLVVLKETTIIT